jgi:hypothetical protein
MPPDNLEKPPTPQEEARDRRAANIFLLVAGAVLVGVGVWLANAMIDARESRRLPVVGPPQLQPDRSAALSRLLFIDLHVDAAVVPHHATAGGSHTHL